ncbi:MAG: hypothetical protein WB392_12635 [Methanotrichaceae archaeon]
MTQVYSVDSSITREGQDKPSTTKPPSASARSLADIRQILNAHMPELDERHKIKSLGIFSSYVWVKARSTSDVDLLVEFSETPDIFKFMNLEDDMTALLGQKSKPCYEACAKGKQRKSNPSRGSSGLKENRDHIDYLQDILIMDAALKRSSYRLN